MENFPCASDSLHALSRTFRPLGIFSSAHTLPPTKSRPASSRNSPLIIYGDCATAGADKATNAITNASNHRVISQSLQWLTRRKLHDVAIRIAHHGEVTHDTTNIYRRFNQNVLLTSDFGEA